MSYQHAYKKLWHYAIYFRKYNTFSKKSASLAPVSPIISHSHYIAHTNPIFSSLNILKVYDLANTAILVLMHKSINNTLPHKFQTYFQYTSQIHSYCTRGAEKYTIPYARTICRSKYSLQVIGPRLWNSLPPTLQAIKTLQLFKSKLKHFFILDYGMYWCTLTWETDFIDFYDFRLWKGLMYNLVTW
jgi:hypothetical protein